MQRQPVGRNQESFFAFTLVQDDKFGLRLQTDVCLSGWIPRVLRVDQQERAAVLFAAEGPGENGGVGCHLGDCVQIGFVRPQCLTFQLDADP